MNCFRCGCTLGYNSSTTGLCGSCQQQPVTFNAHSQVVPAVATPQELLAPPQFAQDPSVLRSPVREGAAPRRVAFVGADGDWVHPDELEEPAGEGAAKEDESLCAPANGIPSGSDRISAPAAEKAPRIHELKTWPEFYERIISGEKTFEVRKDDRGFRVGDVLRLREWRRLSIDPTYGSYTGRETLRPVTYVLSGWGLDLGYVCMALGKGTTSHAEILSDGEGKAHASASDPSSSSSLRIRQIEAEHEKAMREIAKCLSPGNQNVINGDLGGSRRCRCEPINTYTPMMWVAMTDDQRYEEYIRIREIVTAFQQALSDISNEENGANAMRKTADAALREGAEIEQQETKQDELTRSVEPGVYPTAVHAANTEKD
jgi:hypothetical protein